jgi:hypothetical protein
MSGVGKNIKICYNTIVRRKRGESMKEGDKILAIDPGKTTGYAVAVVVDTRNYNGYELLQAGHIEWTRRVQDFQSLLSGCIETGHLYLVVEEFRLYAHKAEAQIGNEFPSVRFIGMAETLWYLAGLNEEDIIYQQAVLRKSAEIPKRDKTKLTGKRHAQDAYKHLRYFFIVQAKKKGNKR